jgi:hemoglobin-like flavoprotein
MSRYDAVQESYVRCRSSQGFFDDFYQDFLNSSEEVKAKFSRTNFEKQNKHLRESIVFMILFAEGGEYARQIIDQLGVKHNREHLNITPGLYGLWLESLIRTIYKHDTQMTPDLESSWREAMEVGIELLKARY